MMFSLFAGFHYYQHCGVTGFRCGLDSSRGLVRGGFGQYPLNGAIYIFFNRSRTQDKLLDLKGYSFTLYRKRLERGTYEIPTSCDENEIRMSSESVQFILQGMQLQSD